MGGRTLTALGTIKDDPGAKIVREVFETMGHPSWDEQDVASGKRMATTAVAEPAAASYHHVQLVPRVRGLLIAPTWSVVLHQHTAMGEYRGGALAFRNRMCHGLLNRGPSPLKAGI